MPFLALILKWLGGGILGRALDSVDRSIDNETERQRIKGDVVREYLRANMAMMTGRGWWFPLFFVVPLGLWFASVCIYSILWCRGCAFPQDWTIAALPSPLDEWSGAIIATLFGGVLGAKLVAGLRK